jgi:hypothetical protein
MGFFPTGGRFTVEAVIAGINSFSRRAEYLHIHEEVPWKDLLSGMSADDILTRDKEKLIAYCRARGLRIGFIGDLNDGLSRGEEAPQLRALGRSITEVEVQRAYSAYVRAFVRRFKPDYVGLASETNLVRQAAPPKLYAAVVAAANATAADLAAAGLRTPPMISVQVEAAWGVLVNKTRFQGIAADIKDFPFARMLGLSSYPYFGYTAPEAIPRDYYTRLVGARRWPAMVVEGGWTSASVGSVTSTPALQARYIVRHAELLDSIRARGVIQTLYADLDLTNFPIAVPEILPLFTQIGLTDADLKPKPALAVWDGLFARKLG